MVLLILGRIKVSYDPINHSQPKSPHMNYFSFVSSQCRKWLLLQQRRYFECKFTISLYIYIYSITGIDIIYVICMQKSHFVFHNSLIIYRTNLSVYSNQKLTKIIKIFKMILEIVKNVLFVSIYFCHTGQTLS